MRVCNSRRRAQVRRREHKAVPQVAGHDAADMFIGGTLQIDQWGNSSTATVSRMSGFGGAPNLGCDPNGRRHAATAWLKCGAEAPAMAERIGGLHRGKKLVVQLAETFREKMTPGFVRELDAVELAKRAGLPIEPVMIYGDDITHIVTEEGIACLHKCRDLEERMAAIRGVAGYTELGMSADPRETRRLRDAGIIKTPEDLNIDITKANRSMLAAKNIRDLVKWSGGLYCPPGRFKNW
ncbi:MAG: malonate decarboxylase subunit alpha [Synergistes sp.]|nr:malonate decarboxylase subunit alpha [Synergistes sp.]